MTTENCYNPFLKWLNKLKPGAIIRCISAYGYNVYTSKTGDEILVRHQFLVLAVERDGYNNLIVNVLTEDGLPCILYTSVTTLAVKFVWEHEV